MISNGGFRLAILCYCLSAYLPSQAHGQEPGNVWLQPTIEELDRFEQADGTSVVVGRYGGEQDVCDLGSRALIKRLASDGSELWHLYHQALTSPLCNRRDGALLLDGFSSLDTAFVTASGLHDVVVDEPTGDIYATGEVQVAWLEGEQLMVAKGVVVGHWDAAGSLIRDAYFGPTPDGAPPPSTSCVMLCDLGDDPDGGTFGDAGGRGLSLDGQDVLITGWHRQLKAKDRDALVARLSGNPLSLDWSLDISTEGEDEGRGIVVDELGDIFVTGFAGKDRDVLLARLRPEGTLHSSVVFPGPQDDEGHDIAFGGPGELIVSGRFSQELTLGPHLLTAEPDTSQVWVGIFSKDLVPISAQVDVAAKSGVAWDGQSGEATKTRQLALPGQVQTDDLVPVDFEVVTGSLGGGGLRQLSLSDDRYLRIVSDEEQHIELDVSFNPQTATGGMPLFLRGIRAEVRSDFCYIATVSIQGVSSPELLVAGQRQLCPSEEPILEVSVTPELSALLGLDGQTPWELEHRLKVRLSIQFLYSPPVLPPGIFGQTTEQDSSVDQISADVEY